MKKEEAEDLLDDAYAAWAMARSFAELLQLNIEFLEHRLPAHPSSVFTVKDVQAGTAGPDEETDHIVGPLVELNRLGFWTTMSQPGMGGVYHKNKVWVQRAAVTGFVQTKKAAALRRLNDPSIKMVWRNTDDIPITLVNKRPYTFFGYLERAKEYRGRVGKGAFAALRATRHVQIYDIVWERNDYLWPRLIEALS